MELRPYRADDRDACLAVFDSSAGGDRGKFEEFLRAPGGPYFVMEHEGAIVGCGGYAAGLGDATLVWGMIRRDLQGQGLERFLLMYRLREIGKLEGVERVRVEASQEEAKFFEGQGFRLAGAANGRVEMVKKLAVCS